MGIYLHVDFDFLFVRSDGSQYAYALVRGYIKFLAALSVFSLQAIHYTWRYMHMQSAHFAYGVVVYLRSLGGGFDNFNSQFYSSGTVRWRLYEIVQHALIDLY